MKKFILIDHSIKDSGGHHLEYAARVLRAAKAEGFETVLATNKVADIGVIEDVDSIKPVFTYTFWENFRSESIRSVVKGGFILEHLRNFASRLKYSFLFTDIGFSVIALKEGFGLREILERYSSGFSGRSISVVSILIAWVLTRLEFVVLKVEKKLSFFGRLYERTKRVLKLFTLLFAALVLSPILIFVVLVGLRRVSKRRQHYVDTFLADLRNMEAVTCVNDGDVIFIPTLGNPELLGCAEFIRATNKKFSWHFLFRRNIFEKREPSYSEEMQRNFTLAHVLSHTRKDLREANAFFYTDTDALTEQYNRFGVFDFKTLPIPHDESLIRTKSLDGADGVIRVTYLGDARDEKGFQLLPKLVDDMFSLDSFSRRISFVFQSNFNTKLGEPETRVAKSELSHWDCARVNLIEGPFGSDVYNKLICDSDILLIPYNARNYYARSSGVYAEARVAGVPFVTADKSWMSQELLQERNSHFSDCVSKFHVRTLYRFDGTEKRAKLTLNGLRTDSSPIIIKVVQKFPKPGVFLDISRQSTGEPCELAKRFLQTSTVDLRALESYCLIRANATHGCELSLHVDFGDGKPVEYDKSEFSDIELFVIELQNNDEITDSFCGATYVNDDDFTLATLEVLNKYSLYEKQAKTSSIRWASLHSARTLVRVLGEA
ncbi:hypothetical protein [Permianibacter aggregans]|uniref:Glycosyltransferase involved in cell wall biosynthesis n=1 Tax=Permianibacter aggregans TaxID=1510150 RepID=A0A4V3D8D0_9GAMM|nr:hypothetical protein [Permianibacter aggregans]QGX41331.1 hypothetical protein E2H98_17325 [Permianibacter aggregans]TDQ51117.1 hypothetical protein EV696_10186 [Permianibacter aggregans]